MGSMRHAELKREGKKIADFDLYSLLARGDMSQDVPLASGDVLYIPAIGPVVALTGSVERPAIYEMSAGETVGDLIRYAGGASALASAQRIAIDRIENHTSRFTVEIAFDTAGLATPLSSGDILRVFPMIPDFTNTVTLRGSIANSGRFSWHQGMRLSDVIPDRNALVSRSYWWRRAQLGIPVPKFKPLPSLNTLHQSATPVDVILQQVRRVPGEKMELARIAAGNIRREACSRFFACRVNQEANAGRWFRAGRQRGGRNDPARSGNGLELCRHRAHQPGDIENIAHSLQSRPTRQRTRQFPEHRVERRRCGDLFLRVRHTTAPGAADKICPASGRNPQCGCLQR